MCMMYITVYIYEKKNWVVQYTFLAMHIGNAYIMMYLGCAVANGGGVHRGYVLEKNNKAQTNIGYGVKNFWKFALRKIVIN